ncbi:M15 family metallopeptidase [Candidatus Poriferisocius sp.]|uniref:M15 family metallopeptidase n=1 Tax=Candidatus Poriferisocius sp. TaxID=3101276 RepID=UPI003B01B97D
MTKNPAIFENRPSAPPAAAGGLLMAPEAVPDQRLGWCRHLPPMPAAFGLPAVRQRCAGSSQPLVEVRGIDVLDAYEHLGILGARRMLVRSDVAKRLLLAERLLPSGFSLVVLDAWRSPDEQRALVCHYGDGAAEDGFVAPVSDHGCRPPHTTGGTVDLTLSWLDQPLALGTDYDAFDANAAVHAFEAPGADARVRLLRRGFAYAMATAGFVPYEKEWWHWSHGDDVWAQATGRAALYDIVEHPPLDGTRSAGICLD